MSNRSQDSDEWLEHPHTHQAFTAKYVAVSSRSLQHQEKTKEAASIYSQVHPLSTRGAQPLGNLDLHGHEAHVLNEMSCGDERRHLNDRSYS